MTERSDMDLPDGGKSYKLVAEGAESTVVAEYEPSHSRETAYQSEADLEEELLRILESQGYERLSAHTESELIANLRTQLEKLNDVRFTDNEWSHFFHEVIASSTAGIEDKTLLLPRDAGILSDFRSLRVVKGVARVPEQRTKDKTGGRHGDSVIACAMMLDARKELGSAEPWEYVGIPMAGFALNGW